MAALSVLRLLPPRIGRTVAGSVRFDGQDLLALSEAEMRDIRGNRIAMIFQEPMTSLNPVLTIGHQIAEALARPQGDGPQRRRASARACMLEVVRIPDAQSRLDDYPHQFSGGMRQRVMIAMALACSPKLLIADEPTTALDVTIQAQVLKLILELKEKTGAAVILITHDLGVVAETCQRVVVMYAGRKVEEASVLELFDRPAHPYTRGLLASIARGRAGARAKRLQEIPGVVPSLKEPIAGCAFAPRCSHAMDRCHREAPALHDIGSSDGGPASGSLLHCRGARCIMTAHALRTATPARAWAASSWRSTASRNTFPCGAAFSGARAPRSGPSTA